MNQNATESELILRREIFDRTEYVQYIKQYIKIYLFSLRVTLKETPLSFPHIFVKTF